jgi:hypothetical protein
MLMMLEPRRAYKCNILFIFEAKKKRDRSCSCWNEGALIAIMLLLLMVGIFGSH